VSSEVSRLAGGKLLKALPGFELSSFGWFSNKPIQIMLELYDVLQNLNVHRYYWMYLKLCTTKSKHVHGYY